MPVSPGEGADDDVIFDGSIESSGGLPGILEEAEEGDDVESAMALSNNLAESDISVFPSLNDDKKPILSLSITPATPSTEDMQCDLGQVESLPSLSDITVRNVEVNSSEQVQLFLEAEKKTDSVVCDASTTLKNLSEDLLLEDPSTSFLSDASHLKNASGIDNAHSSQKNDLTEINVGGPIAATLLENKEISSFSSANKKNIDYIIQAAEKNDLVLQQGADIEKDLSSYRHQIPKAFVDLGGSEPHKPVVSEESDVSVLKIKHLSETSADTNEEEALEHMIPMTLGSDSPSAFVPYKAISSEEEPLVQRQSSGDEIKEKKGVLLKFLEFVGVKKRDEPEGSSSVFYCESQSGMGNAEENPDHRIKSETSEQQRKSPSPRLIIQSAPDTCITQPTPPEQEEQTLECQPSGEKKTAISFEIDANNSQVKHLSVDDVFLETPPVVDSTSPVFDKPEVDPKSNSPRLDRDNISSVIDGIITKAKLIAEDRKESALEPIYSNVVKKAARIVIPEPPPPPPPINVAVEFEEIKVTSNDDRKKAASKPVSSKLSSQILKAIPPPRRKAISDAGVADVTDVDIVIEKPIHVVGQRPRSRSPNITIEDSCKTNQCPPPVPPRRNRSKQRTSTSSPSQPQPPPKRKPKK